MTTRRIAIALWVISLGLGAVALALHLASFSVPVPDSWGFRGFTLVFTVAFSTLGALIVVSRRNLVGWLLLAAGLGSGVQSLAEAYAIYGVLWRPGSLPFPEIFAWIESWIWVLTVALVAIYVPLVFPDGRLRSRRWVAVVVAAAAVALVMIAGLTLNEGPLNNAPFVRNPFGVPGVRLIDASAVSPTASDNTSLFLLTYGLLFACAAAAGGSLALRYRDARGIERQQLKWLAYGGSIVAVAMIAGGYLQEYKAFQVFFIAAILLVPLCVAVAVLRYRLYDIDVLVNRTLVYGSLSAVLAATYIGFVVLSQAVLRPLTGGSEVAVAVSTLVTLALAQPFRRRIQDAVDRRFYRSRYDAALTLDAFATRLRDEVDLDALRADVLDVIGDTIRPAHASVWLRGMRS